MEQNVWNVWRIWCAWQCPQSDTFVMCGSVQQVVIDQAAFSCCHLNVQAQP